VIAPDTPEEAAALAAMVAANRQALGLAPQCKYCEAPTAAHAADCRALKPKVYAFINGPDGIGGHHVVALAEDGEALAGHASSTEDWAMRDIDSPHKHKSYATKYPNGYDFLWLTGKDPDDLVLIRELAAKNQAYAKPVEQASALK
jgi:hypothetical protein